MTIEHEYASIQEQLDRTNPRPITRGDIIALLDLTLLDTEADAQALEQFAGKLENYPVAAACVYPQHLVYLPQRPSLKKATVVNFPSGRQSQAQVEQDIHRLSHDKRVDEIDYVFPYSRYLAGETQAALAHCRVMAQHCRDKHMVFKVILETGAFSSCATLYRACRDVLEQGCDFLKTSTGKIPVGATPLAAFTLLKAIKEANASCGIKLSGGIKQTQQALAYIHLAEYYRGEPVHPNRFRIGASSLLDDLLTSNRVRDD